jgi:hypothetical protein
VFGKNIPGKNIPQKISPEKISCSIGKNIPILHGGKNIPGKISKATARNIHTL